MNRPLVQGILAIHSLYWRLAVCLYSVIILASGVVSGCTWAGHAQGQKESGNDWENPGMFLNFSCCKQKSCIGNQLSLCLCKPDYFVEETVTSWPVSLVVYSYLYSCQAWVEIRGAIPSINSIGINSGEVHFFNSSFLLWFHNTPTHLKLPSTPPSNKPPPRCSSGPRRRTCRRWHPETTFLAMVKWQKYI